MIKLKKYSRVFKLFVTYLTFLGLISCLKPHYSVQEIEGKRISITENQAQETKIEEYISPYRNHIDTDLRTVLAYAPKTLDKSDGKWQSSIGNLLADISFKAANSQLERIQKNPASFCLLNSGGIRSILPKGNVTTRTAYEIMPFENSMVVVALKGEQVQELVDYFIQDKKAHPLTGLTFTIDKNFKAKAIAIQGIPLNLNEVYYVVTNDYIANGGDNMIFFKKGVEKIDLNYKLRNVLIDYFKSTDTIKAPTDIRIKEE